MSVMSVAFWSQDQDSGHVIVKAGDTELFNGSIAINTYQAIEAPAP